MPLEGIDGRPLAAIRPDVVRGDALTDVLGSLLIVEAGATVVEVGCGAGGLAIWFAERNADGRVIGLDANAAMLSRGVRQATGAALKNLSFAVGDAYRLPLQDERADIVICKSLLCVLRDVDRAVVEMRRALKPGGLLIAVEPCSSQLFYDPEDPRFAELSHKLNFAFHEGWRRRGVDQRVGLRVPGFFLRHGLEQVVVELVNRVHLVADFKRSPEDVAEQLETESYQLPESTVLIVLDGGMSRRELQEHNRLARERLLRFRVDPGAARQSGYIRLNPALIVTIGRKQPRCGA